MPSEAPYADLHQAIRDLHGCESEWIETMPIVETFEGQTVWEGDVEVFDLIDHPTASRCYAWSYQVNETGKRRYLAVLPRRADRLAPQGGAGSDRERCAVIHHSGRWHISGPIWEPRLFSELRTPPGIKPR